MKASNATHVKLSPPPTVAAATTAVAGAGPPPTPTAAATTLANLQATTAPATEGSGSGFKAWHAAVIAAGAAALGLGLVVTRNKINSVLGLND